MMATSREPISMTDIVRYSGASGDLNPLHHDPAFASRAGYDRVVVMGALPGGWAANSVSPTWSGPRTLTVAYKRPIMIADELTLVERDGGADVLRGEDRVTAIDVEDAVELATTDGPARASYPFLVETGAGREFRRAVWADGAAAANVPPTFLASVSRWRPDGGNSVRELGFDYKRMLHARSVFRYVDGPLRVGEELVAAEYHGPRTTRQRANGDEMKVASALWTFHNEEGVRAQLEYELVELAARSNS